MQRVCAAAAERGVAIGAQVGYRDLAGFGRRRMDIAAADLTADVLYQLGALDAFARVGRDGGALRETARRAVQHRSRRSRAGRCDRGGRGPATTRRCRCSGCPSSQLETAAAQAGIAVRRRGVRRPRLHTRRPVGGAQRSPARCTTTSRPSSRRRCRWCATAWCTRVDGTPVRVSAASLCVHGDTPAAASLARAVRSALEERRRRAGPVRAVRVLPYGERALLAELDDPHAGPGAARGDGRASQASSTRWPARARCSWCSIRRSPRRRACAPPSIGASYVAQRHRTLPDRCRSRSCTTAPTWPQSPRMSTCRQVN